LEILMSMPRVADARRKTAKARPPSRTVLTNARGATEFLKALAHEARLVILCLLVEGEKTVTELEDLIGLRQAAISQQLARLRAENLVAARRNGKNMYYSLARPEVREIVEALHRAFCRR